MDIINRNVKNIEDDQNNIINSDTIEIQEQKKKFIIYSSLISINIDFFNSNFVYYDMNNFKDGQFIGITYRSPTIFLDGLMFETPWMEVSKPIYKLPINKDDITHNSKYFIELSFNGYQQDPELKLFYNCMSSLDKHCNSFLNKQQKSLISKNVNETYCKNIKNYISTNNDKYTYIRVKANDNLNNIMVDNSKYNDTISSIKIKDSYVKCWIICYGLWRYNNKIGMSWKVVKMNVNKSDQYLDDQIFTFDEDIEDAKIPNYEIEGDIDYQEPVISNRYQYNDDVIGIQNNSVQSLGEENMNIFDDEKN